MALKKKPLSITLSGTQRSESSIGLACSLLLWMHMWMHVLMHMWMHI